MTTRLIDDDEDYTSVTFFDNGDHWLVVFSDDEAQTFNLRVDLADIHIVNDLLARYPITL